MKISGYCQNCRKYEMNQYGALVEGTKHAKAVEDAKCGHPVFYEVKSP